MFGRAIDSYIVAYRSTPGNCSLLAIPARYFLEANHEEPAKSDPLSLRFRVAIAIVTFCAVSPQDLEILNEQWKQIFSWSCSFEVSFTGATDFLSSWDFQS
jgi:hypothetical protein